MNSGLLKKNKFSLSCSKDCGYGGTQKRFRAIRNLAVTGERICDIPLMEERECQFHRCCGEDFHCSKSAKCIDVSLKCDYKNDCEHKEDENDASCQEECVFRYDFFNSIHILIFSK